MTDEQIVIKLTEHEEEIKSLKHRMKNYDDEQKEQSKLLRVVDRLATNMENMAKEQQEMRKELDKLEQEPIEDYKHYKRTTIGCIITTILGLLIGLIADNIF